MATTASASIAMLAGHAAMRHSVSKVALPPIDRPRNTNTAARHHHGTATSAPASARAPVATIAPASQGAGRPAQANRAPPAPPEASASAAARNRASRATARGGLAGPSPGTPVGSGSEAFGTGDSLVLDRIGPWR